MDRIGHHRAIIREMLLALGLAAAMSLVWALRDWADLSALFLPDTDDMMRLQQVRDLLAGQGWADVSQHRLGNGLAMHWSRIGDIGPAAFIVMFRPLLGSHVAEIAAVVVYPAVLLATALFLLGRISMRLGGERATVPVMLLGLVAYPMTTLFLPGRIDHHGLQVVLALGVVANLVGPPTFRRAVVAGAMAGISLAVGLEGIAIVAGGTLAAGLSWLRAPDARLAGLGVGLLVASLAALALFVPHVWPSALCDSFTPPVAILTITAGALLITLGLSGFALALRGRLVAIVVAAISMAAALLIAAPACLAGPYGAVDPELARLWLSHVVEAKPLWAQPIGIAVGYAGVMLAGLLVSVTRAGRSYAWRVLLVVQLCAVTVALVQARGCALATALGLPALAAWIVEVRSRSGVPVRLCAWVASCGIVYAVVGGLIHGGKQRAAERAVGNCATPSALAGLATLPPGRVLAPIDLGAYVIAATRHEAIAAPYHRNTGGNLASLHFFGGQLDDARAVLPNWRPNYVVVCERNRQYNSAPAMLIDDQLVMISASGDVKIYAWIR